ncbi:MAG: PAS domain-containing protein, partial [candidate division Zixibacteria bacterium]|nr:PAS domain-containing protein [candidate division Zixibacteria bacterium]
MIIVLLLSLNVLSNYVVYRARTTHYDETVAHLQKASLAITRVVYQDLPRVYTADDLRDLQTAFDLSDVLVVPSRPIDNSSAAKREWFASIVPRLPVVRGADLAGKLFSANLDELTRGEGDQYFGIFPFKVGAGDNLLVLSVSRPELAYLDGARDLIFFVQLAALLVVGAVYVLLSRFIFSPFRRLRQTAQEAGRTVDSCTDDGEAIVREYEKVISELRSNEAELMRLNRATQSRADSLEHFNRYLLDTSHVGVMTIDASGLVVAINETARSHLSLPEAQATDALFDEVLAGKGNLPAVIEQALANRQGSAYTEYGDLIADRPDVVLGVTVSVVHDVSQTMQGLLVFINDLSEMTRLRRQLEHKDRLTALGEMAGGLAHQLRNSMGAISGYGNLIRRDLGKNSLPTSRVETLLTEVDEAGDLISRFLTFSRPFDFEAVPVRIDRLIGDTVDQIRFAESARGVDITVDSPDDLVVNGDPVLLKQALGNIVDNAARA